MKRDPRCARDIVAALALLVLGLACGCDSPTLPVPPPEAPHELNIPDAELLPGGEEVMLSGAAEPGNLVIAINMDLLALDEAAAVRATRADAYGAYTMNVPVDLHCMRTNFFEISQRNALLLDSPVREFPAPNVFNDVAVPGPCGDGGMVGSASGEDASDATAPFDAGLESGD